MDDLEKKMDELIMVTQNNINSMKSHILILILKQYLPSTVLHETKKML
jgi:hypothetical protein